MNRGFIEDKEVMNYPQIYFDLYANKSFSRAIYSTFFLPVRIYIVLRITTICPFFKIIF